MYSIWTLCVCAAAELFYACFQFCFCFVEFPLSPPLIRIVSQSGNRIGADGGRAIADAMRSNSSVRELILVRWCHFLILLLVL